MYVKSELKKDLVELAEAIQYYLNATPDQEENRLYEIEHHSRLLSSEILEILSPK